AETTGAERSSCSFRISQSRVSNPANACRSAAAHFSARLQCLLYPVRWLWILRNSGCDEQPSFPVKSDISRIFGAPDLHPETPAPVCGLAKSQVAHSILKAVTAMRNLDLVI